MLKVNQVFVSFLIKYLILPLFFFKKSAIILLKYIQININIINLKRNKPLFYELIYSLEQIELKSLKTFIQINLINGFIRLSKLFASI